MIAGLSGGAGKTLVSLGLARAWSRSGRRLRAFKKGPDYIDAAWLGLAARRDATNLDPFFLSQDQLRALFAWRCQDHDLALLEGNRGLFDGMDLHGSCASSTLARTLAMPLAVVIDATKMTRTAAAIVKGIQTFEENLPLAGVICNRTAGERHRAALRQTIEHHTGVPVLGMLPKIKDNPIPERHMGLTSLHERQGVDAILDQLADLVSQHLDLPALEAAAQAAPDFPAAPPLVWPGEDAPPARKPRIGVVRDAALWFYYEENLEALRRAGAELVTVSLLDAAPWPEIQGLYLGGGFPEEFAEALAANATVRQRVRTLAEMGLPIHAECGGFMYLAEQLVVCGRRHPMAGVFPVSTELCGRPQGLGYVEARVVAANPFLPDGLRFKGHEFHYSRCVPNDGAALTLALKLDKGEGMLVSHDGLVHKNTFAAYTHLHALAVPDWAPRFVAAAARLA